MKKGIQSIILFIIGGICFSSCSDSDNSTSIIPKDSTDQVLVKSLSEYVTVKDLQWTLSISKDEAYQLGFSGEDYDDSINELSLMNKSLEELKKDTNTIIHLILPTERIIIKQGKTESLKKKETKACYSHDNHRFITKKDIQANNGGYVSFDTPCADHKICIEGIIDGHMLSMVGSWQIDILDDVWKVKRVVMGAGKYAEFELEWMMGGTGFPVTYLNWKFFINYLIGPTGYPTWATVSFYVLNN